ncbi:hypothetical protein, conserved [Eimeria tenella]|uniref:DNA-directed RNA polymerase III subunit RPC9 n=1 Tax=Eimeria tenella TaxID=5802 RepID=U6KT75_EIMTE|nr:hypothetical protein, conserved [Eimeria tenella]CDJ41322.1 hypothetical protein, conserved [Eimeria tenella]|eukprot:XP_013232072.1 hypothetical protein, conserved [Eimeria tenella]
MKVLEERCDVITNMEVMLLLVQQQQLLPSVESLLRHASKPSSASPGSAAPAADSKGDSRNSNDRQSGANGQCEPTVERLKLDHVKELLYQHTFNQMVQDYIRKTCPYLHLARVPPDPRSSQDRTRMHNNTKAPTKRSPSGQTGNRRTSGVTGNRQGGNLSLISKHCRECLDALVHRFGLTDLELLTIMNLGAFKPVEIYTYLDDCPNRFTEEDAAAMLHLIDLALVQQQPLPPAPEPAREEAAPMAVDAQADPQEASAPAAAEFQALQLQHEELEDEARELGAQQHQVQLEANETVGSPANSQLTVRKDNGNDEQHNSSSAANACLGVSDTLDLFAPAEAASEPGACKAGSADATPKEAKPRAKAVRGAAKRRPVSRRKRVIDD